MQAFTGLHFLLKTMKYIILSILFISCSSFNKLGWTSKKEKEVELSLYSEYTSNDYLDHLKHYERTYLLDKKKEIIRLNHTSTKYIKSLIRNITSNNELFFNQLDDSKVYVIESDIPFHFSLPGRRIFFSSSLLNKYIKNETMLYCLLVYELIRSEKAIYKKTIIIPTGTISTSRILSLLRLETKNKVEIHKWAFYILKRIGIDTDSYLSWLQIKNRNSLDFALQIGDIQSVSREESLFKAFLIEEVKNLKRSTQYTGSSKQFYTFLNQIKK
jgi:hypothetical protein